MQQRDAFTMEPTTPGYPPPTAKSRRSQSHSHGLVINATPQHACASLRGLRKLTLSDGQRPGPAALVSGLSAAVRTTAPCHHWPALELAAPPAPRTWTAASPETHASPSHFLKYLPRQQFFNGLKIRLSLNTMKLHYPL